ncbi:glycosyltransferase family 2 protein [Blastococcus sp. TF02-09]|uniref:glycosyltransferase family 2 protein n=1 Tax=Blastococcus sp. TF02-09 TaxID=2250576 RepID=UPI000DEB7AFC|nr:glycosyltransferase [Blastococcus sp. TF02-9]RBY80127.1 glycosyltransferase family 2 protein [Blastococcus sp. TF02-9]
MTSAPVVGVVVLTQGRRPAELDRAVRSALAQRNVVVDVVVVGNGWQPTGLPDGVRAVGLAENLGIPAGRNAGVPHVAGDLLLFLDDDATLVDPSFLARAVHLFDARPDLGLLQPRVDGPGGVPGPRRWTPRMRVGERERSSAVFSVWEGAVVVRRAVLERTGGWPDPFFYAHEGIELAWRVWDAGAVVHYAGDLAVEHPLTAFTRHRDFYRLNARNRVWLAKRNLPWVLGVPYVLVWTALQVARSVRTPATLVPWFRGWAEGWRTDAGPRRTLRWGTIARMTRHGRPPVV